MKKILSLIAFGALLLAGCQKPHKLEINTEPDPMRFVQVTVPSEKMGSTVSTSASLTWMGPYAICANGRVRTT